MTYFTVAQRRLKIKNGDGSIYDEGWPKLGSNLNNQWGPGLTFAEKLQGINHDGKMGEAVVEDNALSDDSISDTTSNFLKFSFFEKVRKRLCKAWNKAVIVKLLGRNIGYKLLLSILQKLWAKKGVLTLINIGNGFFVVKFTNREDYLNSLTRGPWMLFDHYLTVRPWEPQFQPKSASINKVAVWVSCGMYGHKVEECKLKKKIPVAEANPEDGADKVAMGGNAMKDGRMEHGDKSNTQGDTWIVVQRPRLQKKVNKEKSQGDFQREDGGSRFGVLAEDRNDGDVPQTVTGPISVPFLGSLYIV
ncbi:hypothetical protein K1719_017624 [Acacia pycnantha]|nr:hypothetical protein K1719_017624 [Acacia pycnantha]